MTVTVDTASTQWWRTAVIYQIYPRSFADSTGTGVGDLPGITARLGHLAGLGVDAIWLSPFYTSPQRDAGYDVANFTDVDPLFGTLNDAKELFARAHALGLRVIVDIVPNHMSSDHVWFQEALAAAPDSAVRDRFIFYDGKGADGSRPPNNWRSVFGGPAWTRVTEQDGSAGQWYLHLFDTSQPDLNWQNEEVCAFFDDVLRFWLDLGVDGFRVDVAHGLIKKEALPDYTPLDGHAGSDPHAPYWGQDGVHEVWRRWRRLLDSYPGERILTAEAWVDPLSRMAQWVRPDEMHQAFNFSYLRTPWQAQAMRTVIVDSLREFSAVGAPSTWVLSNHDVVRHTSRLAISSDISDDAGLGPDSPRLPDPAVGLRRGRAATLVMLALPGSAYLYQGEELGLPEAVSIPDEARQDPTWFRTRGEKYGRDGCRVPIPWEADSPAFGFSTAGMSWLPQPPEWAHLARDAQEGLSGSTLHMYTQALHLRAAHGLGSGDFTLVNHPHPDVLAFTVGDVTCYANTGTTDVPLPKGTVLLSSAPVDDTLPADTTVWVQS
ncbi:MAG: glycoside hydrolase family 13 protein [Demequina sp.]